MELDPRTLEELRELELDGADGLVARIIAGFVHSSREKLEHLRETWRCGDLAACGKIVHTLKGSSLQIGALRVGETCRAIEACLVRGAAIADLLPTLERQLARAHELLESALAEQRMLI